MTRARATRVLIGLAVSAGLLYLVLRTVSPAELLSHLGRTHWGWLALSAAFNLAMVGARGLRWVLFFHPAAPASWPLVSATAIGYMANNLLPLRVGELVRGYLAAQSAGLSFWTAMATLAVERVLDALSLLLILGGVVVAVEVPLWLKTGALTLLALDLLAMGILILLARGWDPLDRLLMGIPRLGTTVKRWLGLFAIGLQSLRPGPHLGPLLAWTVLIWILNAGAVWAALRSVGLALPASASLTVLAFAGIAVSLPSAPGYVGTVQFFIVQALAIYAVTGAAAVTFSLLSHAAAYIPMTLLGWIFLLAQGVSLRKASEEARAQATTRAT
ncbi:MAG: flippase-like domain-containing protein [Candidatus Rokubacteria bacterium]|nr:flippase-like domain-containing protein [Candidatus Rokubacteria bacterium]